MSITAVETSRHHSFGHTMVDTMARPVNGWIPEPIPSRHMGYYPADQALRLPPPSSLVSGAPSSHAYNHGHGHVSPTGPPPLHTNVKPSYGYHDYQTPSPIQQASPPLPPPTSQPHHHLTSIAQQGRRHVQDLARVSPTLSSTASERSAEDFQDARMAHSQLPGLHQPTRHHKVPSGEAHYVDVHQSKLPPAYPQSAPVRHTPQPTSPQSRQTWSPRAEPKTDRVKISDLLSDDSRTAESSTAPLPPPSLMPQSESEYRIRVRQQPVAARSCGFGERDRRVIDPPPIVQLTVEHPKLSQEEVSRRMRHPFSVVHCSIWNETGEQDNSAMPEDYRQQRRLMGTLVASPFVGVDENGEEGCFFCFPDLSCRTPGSFRLKFVLVVIDPINASANGKRFPIRATAMSEVFTVYNAKDFPGMQASTPLTKKLKEQGCLISIKKGNEKGSHARDDSDDDDGDSSGPKRKRSKKN